MSHSLLQILDADRRRALANIRAAAERIWSRPLHRYYTDHGVAHSERVIALLDGFTEGLMARAKGRDPKRLAPTEVYVLLAAAYLHDIGMQNERFAGDDPSMGSGQRLEAIRAVHHELTAEMIYRAIEDPAQAIGLSLPDDPSLVEAVALVARGHRKVDLYAAEYDPLTYGGETVRLRLLAALLRFADELDIDHRRVDLEMMKLMNLPLLSQLHWWRCHYVSGVSVVDEFIRVAYRFPRDRPDYEGLIVPLVETDIRAKLADLEEIYRANAIKVALGKPQVRLMRLVQLLPPEVEKVAGTELANAGGPGARSTLTTLSTGAPTAGAESPPSPVYVAPGPTEEKTMSRKEDLESGILESYGIILDTEDILRTSDRPKEKVRAQRVIREQWSHVRRYLAEYRHLVGDALPDDMAQIAYVLATSGETPSAAAVRRVETPMPGRPQAMPGPAAPGEATPSVPSPPGMPMAITYATLEIAIGPRTEAGYPVRVHPSEVVPAARGTLVLDPAGERVRRLVQQIDDRDPQRRGKDLLAEFGGVLFERLFAGEVATSFNRGWGHVRATGQGLRIQLDVEPPELAALPWEYLYYAAEDHFFALSTRTPLTRYVSDLRQPLEPLDMAGRLRALLIAASPREVAPLDLDESITTIAQALADVPGIELLPVVRNPTPRDVREALRRGRPHIVHFVGHGYYQLEDGEEKAGVVLESGAGRARHLDADEYARLFQVPPGVDEVKLLVLNACEGARASSTRPLVGVAHNVLRYVPAVVALQYPVSDVVARSLAHEFYRALAAHYPVDAAISEARNALYIDYGSGRREWGIPVLFLRSRDGCLFASSSDAR